MRILIPGGSGQVGTILARHLFAAGHEVTVLSRHPEAHAEQRWRTLRWDGSTPGPWADEIHRSDAVIHLSGRSRQLPLQRYQPPGNLRLARQAHAPPRQAHRRLSHTAAHLDERQHQHLLPALARPPQDEFTGELGDLPSQRGTHEPAEPPRNLALLHRRRAPVGAGSRRHSHPHTRKIRLRSSMTMSPDPGGVFSVFSKLARLGLGGTQGSGTQYVSWIHDRRLLPHHRPPPRTPRDHRRNQRRRQPHRPQPPPQPRIHARSSAKPGINPSASPPPRGCSKSAPSSCAPKASSSSRAAAPSPPLLLKHGFEFQFPTWPEAAADLVARSKG